MGTGTALVAAYVLATETARCDGDHRAAFARYERGRRPCSNAANAEATEPARSSPRAPRADCGRAPRC